MLHCSGLKFLSRTEVCHELADLFQYCDIEVPEIQEMLEKLPVPAPSAKCHERLGWMPSGMDDRCREIINKFVTEVLKQENIFTPCMLSNV